LVILSYGLGLHFWAVHNLETFRYLYLNFHFNDLSNK
jgi:hypothetical protein